MAIDKSLYQAPQGITGANQKPIEIEIVDPEAIHISAGGLELDIEHDGGNDFSSNLAEDMSESELMTLGSDLVALFEADQAARTTLCWQKQLYVFNLKLLWKLFLQWGR